MTPTRRLESVGQDLRKAREKRGEELDISPGFSKIRRDYLALLEEGAADSLPGRAYAIGFIRSYATYLGLDGNEYVERLKAEIAGRGDNKEPPPSAAPPPEWKWLQGQWILGGLLAVALLYAGYYLIVSATRVTEQPVLPVPARLAAEAGLPPAASSTPPPAATPAPPAQASPPVPAAQAQAPALPPGQTYGAQNTNSRITLRVHRPSQVTVAGREQSRVHQPDASARRQVYRSQCRGFAPERARQRSGRADRRRDVDRLCRRQRRCRQRHATQSTGARRPAKPRLVHEHSPLSRHRAAQVAEDPRRRGRSRRRRADLRPVDDQHADRRTPKRRSRRSSAWKTRAPTSSACRARTKSSTAALEDDRQSLARADRCRHPFPLQARDRIGESGCGVPADQSGQYRLGRSA